MLKLDRLFELLVEAMHGADCNCSVTTRAYLRMAKEEWYRLIDTIPYEVGREKMRSAALYVDTLVERQARSGRLKMATRTAFDFWNGFDDGLHERTFPQRTGAGYRRGYRFAKPQQERKR